MTPEGVSGSMISSVGLAATSSARAVEVAATAPSNFASAVPVAAAIPSSSSPSPAPAEVTDCVIVGRFVSEAVADGPGVEVPLDVELAVGEGPGV